MVFTFRMKFVKREEALMIILNIFLYYSYVTNGFCYTWKVNHFVSLQR